MNENYYLLDTFTPDELRVVHNFFWKNIYPIHSAYKFVKSNTSGGMIVTYFKLADNILGGEIADILARYPMLGRDCLITESIPGAHTSVHCDGRVDEPSRQCAVNFPIAGCTEQSYISFYGPYGAYPAEYNEKFRTTFIANGIVPTEVDRIGLVDKPALINTRRWHSVKNSGTETRVVFSWSVARGLSYEAALMELI